MQLNFKAISEPSQPGVKWQKLYRTQWPAYKSWLNSKESENYPDLKTSQAALKKFMPEMWSTYKQLCKLANADKVAARFLTGFQPPAYVSGCSQAVTTNDDIQLVRNYDFHPELMEGAQLLTSWNGKKVIATSDSLIGAIDGMNEDGLAVSLTFGGRKVVGLGFGIPFILRYVLEFCSNVDEALDALTRIPSHMSYNVTIVDITGKFKTLYLSPDKKPEVTDASFTTNHQGKIDWPENALFNNTLKRYYFLKDILSENNVNSVDVADAFLEEPLYSTKFKEGFGTLFTSVYKPLSGKVELRWPEISIKQSFDNFQEMEKLINYEQNKVLDEMFSQEVIDFAKALEDPFDKKYDQNLNLEDNVTEIIINKIAAAHPSKSKKELGRIREKIIDNGVFTWKSVSGLWSKISSKYASH
ncbi:MAG: C45 family autoproteolytic acyltransferase/hydrolase [Psychroflexus sp.]